MDPSVRSKKRQDSDTLKNSVFIYSRKVLSLFLGIAISAFGCSLTIKAAVGLGAWDAVALTVSNMTAIKVGTVAILFNSLCVIGQVLIEKRSFRPIQFLQFVVVATIGALINFFVYYVFGSLVLTSYILRFILILLAYFIIAFGVTVIMETNLVRNPLEGFCQVIADRIGKPMGRVRQVVDIGLIVVALLLAFLSDTDYTIREGTIVCMILFGPLLDIYKKPVRRLLDRLSV